MKKTILSILALLVVVLFLGAVAVLAAPGNNGTGKDGQANSIMGQKKLGNMMGAIKDRNKNNNINELNARFSNFECTANLVKAQADALNRINVTAPDANKIEQDLQKLKEYADAGDAKGFNSFMQSIINADVRDFQKNITTAKNDYHSEYMKNWGAQRNQTTENVTQIKQERKQMMDNAKLMWQNNIQAFAKCNSDAKKNVARTKEQMVGNNVAQWEIETAAMKAKGLNVTQEEAVIADAKAYAATIANATAQTNDTAFKAQMDAIHDMNLHLQARYAIAKINSYVQKVEPFAQTAGLQSQVDDINTVLAPAIASATSGNKYAEDEFAKTWNSIKDAEKKLQDLVKQITAQINPKSN